MTGLGIGLGIASGIGSLFSSNRQNELIKKQAEIQRDRVMKQSIGEYFQSQIDIGHLQSTLAGGGLDVSDENFKNILETSARASLEQGFDQAEQLEQNILSGQSSALNDLLGAVSTGLSTGFSATNALKSVDYNNQLQKLLDKQRT